MKKQTVTVWACVAMAACAIAAPSPKWVPAEADFVFVVQGQPDLERETVRVWRDALTAAGVTEGPFLLEGQDLPVDEVVDVDDGDFARIQDAFLGKPDALGVHPAQSLTLSFSLPDEPPAETQDSVDAVFWAGKAYGFIENPAFDLEAANAAVDELAVRRGNVARAQQGEWQVLRVTAKGKEAIPAAPEILGGWKPMPGGVMLVAGDDFAKAEALFAGKAPSAADDASVARLFKPSPRATYGLLVRDVKSLLDRYLRDPEIVQQAQMTVGWLWEVRDHWLRIDIVKDSSLAFELGARAKNDLAAGTVRDTFIAYKMLLGGMIIPNVFGTPDSQSARWLMGMQCDSAGDVATMRLSLSPAQYCDLWKEWKAIEEKQEAERHVIPAMEIEPLDDPDAEPMTEEEARAILEGIDLEDK